VAEQSFEIKTWSPASPDKVFAMVADSRGWPRWAGPLIRQSTLEREGQPEADGVGAVRRLGSGPFSSREEIVDYDPPKHLAYVMRGQFPIRGYRSDIDLSDGAHGGTVISWRSRFVPVVPGTGPIFGGFLKNIVGDFARRLAKQAAAADS
jgi:uncharacterized protein YndB with AHSA1/START domain